MATIRVSIFAQVVLLVVALAYGDFTCEDLPMDLCAFSVSSTGLRCTLEKFSTSSNTHVEYTCQSSEIVVENKVGWIETDECIQACGLDRFEIGISSDLLVEERFTQMLCSPNCYQECPNVVDLYFNLAAGEGVFLPKLCESQGSSSRRRAISIKSSGSEEWSSSSSPIEGPIPAFEIVPVSPVEVPEPSFGFPLPPVSLSEAPFMVPVSPVDVPEPSFEGPP
ncbi:hypothetical protein AMTRI_Chr07g81350 [Amborella trichopoda]